MGIFDGVHLGHHEILSGMKSIASKTGGETVIITFWPHPRQLMNSGKSKLKLLTTIEEKQILLEKAGIDHLVILPFTRALSKQDACVFIEETLVKRFGVRHLIVGYNHHFGHDSMSDPKSIKSCAVRFGFESHKLPPRLVNGEEVSSTIIRKALWSGNIKKANNLLGYEFFVKGKIVGGRTIGRKLGFPTANISPNESYKLIPSDGVYAVKLQFNGKIYNAMLNIGVRPTLDSQNIIKTIEVNIFDFSKDIYGQDVNLIIVEKMRDEVKFDSIEKLVRQLQKDRTRAMDILAR